jgi:hypothetical protein
MSFSFYFCISVLIALASPILLFSFLFLLYSVSGGVALLSSFPSFLCMLFFLFYAFFVVVDFFSFLIFVPVMSS